MKMSKSGKSEDNILYWVASVGSLIVVSEVSVFEKSSAGYTRHNVDVWI
jgi:hypothetical protein